MLTYSAKRCASSNSEPRVLHPNAVKQRGRFLGLQRSRGSSITPWTVGQTMQLHAKTLVVFIHLHPLTLVVSSTSFTFVHVITCNYVPIPVRVGARWFKSITDHYFLERALSTIIHPQGPGNGRYLNSHKFASSRHEVAFQDVTWS